MARVGWCFPAPRNLLRIIARRLFPAAVSLAWTALASAAASNHAVAKSLGDATAGYSSNASPYQFLASLILLLGGGALITWLDKTRNASQTPRTAAAARDGAIAMLRDSEARLGGLMLASPVGVMLLNAEGECLYTNGRFQKMTGRRHGQLAGMGWLAGIPVDDRDRVLREWRSASSSGRPFRLEFRLAMTDGNELWAFGQAETDHAGARSAGSFVCTVTDITERKKIEQALAESEAQLRRAQRVANFGNWERDLSSDTIEWSDQVYAIFGLAPQSERMNLARFLSLVHPDDRDDVGKAVAQAVATGDSYRKTHRIVRPDGDVRTVEQQAEVVRDETGNAVRFFGTVQDITDLRRAEDAMRRSEAWFRTGFVAGGAGLVVADSEGRYLRANPAFCKLVGYSEAELREMRMRDLTHPDDREAYEQVWRGFVSGKVAANAREKRYLTRNGETIWAIAASAVFQDPADGEVYVISNIQDITERKLAEQALADREATLREAQTLANIGNWERDLSSGTLNWSDQMYKIFGLDKNNCEPNFETFLSVVHPDDRAVAADRGDPVEGIKSPLSHSFRVVRPDGGIRFVRTERRVEADADGRPVRVLGVLQDVTELRLARDALEASEARFRGVFEAGGAGIVVVDFEGRFQQINRAFADFLGYDEADLAGLTIFDVLRDAHHEELRRNRDNLFAGLAERVSAVYRFAHRDGGARWGEVNATTMTGPHGNRPLMILTVQDVTRRVQADEELARKTTLIDLINELAVAANDATDFESVVRLSLERVCQVAGWPVGHGYRRVDGVARLNSMHIWHISQPERFGPYREITEKLGVADGLGMARAVLDTGEIEWRHRIPHRDGPPGPRAKVAVEVGLCSGFAVPVHVGNEVVAVLEFLSDEPIARDDGLADAVLQIGTILGRVYERQRAETALRRREEQLRQIVDNAPLWISVKDRAGRYLLANKAVADAYGLTLDKIVGRTQGEIYGRPDETARIMESDIDVIDNGVTRLLQNARFHAVDGRVRNLRIVKVPFTTQDGDRAVLGLAADVTDEIRAEAELRRAQRMDALGHMTGGVAHDFNNLLTIILGNLQLLIRRLDDSPERTLAQTAERAARRGADVTGRLLAFARSQPLEPRPTDVNVLIADMVTLVERTLGGGIEIKRRLVDGLWTTMADPAQVENALINLVVNARDAMPDGGLVTLSTKNVSLSRSNAVRRQIGVEPGDYVRLAVRDTGTGMTEEVAARALEPFFTTKEVGKGSGLGLSSIYGFAHQSGGGVRIQTAPGRGTKVSIYLPRCEPSVADASADREEMQAIGRHETVLLVEDEPDVRDFAAQALRALNYRVISMGNAEAAMSVLAADEEKIDVLFTDIVLPGNFDGWSLAEAARERDPKLKIILTSGNWELSGRAPPTTLADAAVLQKPYSHEELAQLVETAIDRGATRSKIE